MWKIGLLNKGEFGRPQTIVTAREVFGFFGFSPVNQFYIENSRHTLLNRKLLLHNFQVFSDISPV